MIELDIVIPVYNEGENILDLFHALEEEVKTQFRVFVCYDFEEDNTLAAIRNRPPRFEVVFVKNEGRGVHAAIMSGIRKTRAPAVLVFGADEANNAGIIDKMYAKFKEGKDVVVASRLAKGGAMEGGPWFKSLVIRVASFVLHWFAGIPATDATYAWRMFSRRLLEKVEIESREGFTYAIELLVKCHRLGWEVGEVPARWLMRKAGKSRFNFKKWLPHYAKWFFYALATTYLGKGPKKNPWVLFFAAFFVTALCLFIIKLFFIIRVDGDARWYADIARGNLHEVIKPFSNRVLHPILGAAFHNYFHVDLALSFFIVGIASLYLFFLCNFFILRKSARLLFIAPLFLLPYFSSSLHEIFLPDVFYVFLTALFIFLLFLGKEALALVVLFLLFITRESTIILALLLLILALLRKKRMLFIAVLAVTLISLVMVSSIGSVSQPNIHGLGGLTYLVAKFFYNFLANTFGAKLWVNTYTTCSPMFRFNLPSVLQMGSIREAGFCGFDGILPLRTLTALFTTFGVMPMVIFYMFRKRWKEILNKSPFWLFVAILYGILHYVIAIPAGTSVSRIVGYAWPVFLLAGPIFANAYFDCKRKFVIPLLMLHLFVAWTPFVMYGFISAPALREVLILSISLGVYAWTFRLLKSYEKIF